MSDSARVVRVEWARLEGRRPRHAGSNARLGPHGQTVRPPLARLTLDDGSSGFGRCAASRAEAAALLGRPFDELFSPQSGALPAGAAFDYPLWDLAGRRAGAPVYALAARLAGRAAPAPYRAPCYDTTLYFDDLHLDSDRAAAELLAAEARQGLAAGHRAFKMKVGRGARHMDTEAGTRRDVAVVRAVRDEVGPDAALMVDANNGYTLNLAKRVLDETADCRLFWLEEPFHEDPVLYEDLKAWLARRGLAVLLADGEGEASSNLLRWARQGLIDVVQYDIFGHGFTAWLALGRQLDDWGVYSAPHHYGGHYGNYAAPHLAGAIARFAFVEWDDAATPGLDASAYAVTEGTVRVPDAPGFGLGLDEAVFQRAVAAGGYRVGP